MTIQFNYNKISVDSFLKDLFVKEMELLDQTFTEFIEAKIYPFNNDVRDIIDTGNFRNSQELYIQDFEAVFSWNVDYAAILYFGYTTGTKNYPARNWILETLAVNPFQYFELKSLKGIKS